MNDGSNRNQSWLLAVIAAIVLLFTLLAVCAFGAVGGYLVARGQFSQDLAHTRSSVPPMSEEGEPAVPVPVPTQDAPFRFEMPEDMPFQFQLPEGLSDLNGALLQEVIGDSPADLAGLQPGDLITAVDGQDITEEQSLADLIGDHAPGDRVTLTYIRLDDATPAETGVDVTLGENPDGSGRAYLGVTFMPFFLNMQFQQP
ncbi:MAG: PDZ domain-containing protein [Anaerolineae bacterium]